MPTLANDPSGLDYPGKSNGNPQQQPGRALGQMVTLAWRKPGVVISGWICPEEMPSRLHSKAPRSRARAGRYPAQSRVPNSGITVRSMATLSPFGDNQTRGSVRSYLERPEASPVVLYDAPIEQFLDRWSIWVDARDPVTGEAVNTDVMAKVLRDELVRRYGIPEDDFYAVDHTKVRPQDGEESVHIHAVVPHQWKMEITRQDMEEIGREIVRALERERTLDRVMGREL